MTNLGKYRARAAKKPLQFWLQPFLLLLIVVLLWRQLPVSAVMYKTRLVQPLPSAHVFYVNLDPAFATEVLRASMQAWRRTEFGGGGDAISFEEVEAFEPLGPPQLLEQGSVYPGKWTPGDVTPLAQTLPELLYRSDTESLYPSNFMVQKGARVFLDPVLKKAGFIFPKVALSQLPGTGSARFSVETGDDGCVVHVLTLDPDVKSAASVERLLYRGVSKKAVRGEVQVMWRNP